MTNTAAPVVSQHEADWTPAVGRCTGCRRPISRPVRKQQPDPEQAVFGHHPVSAFAPANGLCDFCGAFQTIHAAATSPLARGVRRDLAQALADRLKAGSLADQMRAAGLEEALAGARPFRDGRVHEEAFRTGPHRELLAPFVDQLARDSVSDPGYLIHPGQVLVDSQASRSAEFSPVDLFPILTRFASLDFGLVGPVAEVSAEDKTYWPLRPVEVRNGLALDRGRGCLQGRYKVELVSIIRDQRHVATREVRVVCAFDRLGGSTTLLYPGSGCSGSQRPQPY